MYYTGVLVEQRTQRVFSYLPCVGYGAVNEVITISNMEKYNGKINQAEVGCKGRLACFSFCCLVCSMYYSLSFIHFIMLEKLYWTGNLY